MEKILRLPVVGPRHRRTPVIIGDFHMELLVNQSRVEFVLGDIADQSVDAIVNAANSRLAGGGGVDGAIHRRGGPSIMEETRRRYPNGCPTGSAVISAAGDLAARWVIHAVSPIWRGGTRSEATELANAYRQSLQLAFEHDCESLALPSLGTGAYAYPLDAAAEIAVCTVCQFLSTHSRPRLVRFVLWNRDAVEAFARACDRQRKGT